jgi:hypothetical protein
MKKTLFIAIAAFGILGCASDRRGAIGPDYETTEGRSYGWENDAGPRDPRGPWENWRYGGDPDRIAPTIPLDPDFPPAPAR